MVPKRVRMLIMKLTSTKPCELEAKSGPDDNGKRYCKACYRLVHGVALAVARSRSRSPRLTLACRGQLATGERCGAKIKVRHPDTDQRFCRTCWNLPVNRRIHTRRLTGKRTFAGELHPIVPLAERCRGILPDGDQCPRRHQGNTFAIEGEQFCNRCFAEKARPDKTIRRPVASSLWRPQPRRRLT